METSSPSDSFTTGGPAVNTAPCSVMTLKSDMGTMSAPWPADGPITALSTGTRPEHFAWTSRSVGARPPPPPPRWPAPSSSMISGIRSRRASSAMR